MRKGKMIITYNHFDNSCVHYKIGFILHCLISSYTIRFIRKPQCCNIHEGSDSFQQHDNVEELLVLIGVKFKQIFIKNNNS